MLSINKASTGFVSLEKEKITSMMGAPCNTLFMRCLEYLAEMVFLPAKRGKSFLLFILDHESSLTSNIIKTMSIQTHKSELQCDLKLSILVKQDFKLTTVYNFLFTQITRQLRKECHKLSSLMLMKNHIIWTHMACSKVFNFFKYVRLLQFEPQAQLSLYDMWREW